MRPRAGTALAALAASVTLLALACERERRAVPLPAEAGRAAAAGAGPVDLQGVAYDLGEGKRLYVAFNCVGCHAHGGGGIGPALMDGAWKYGGEPAQVFESIAAGRPDGMPAFGGRIPGRQLWQLVAYVRSLAGLSPKDAAPQRSDHMSVKPPESETPAGSAGGVRR